MPPIIQECMKIFIATQREKILFLVPLYFSLHYGLDNCEIVNGRNQNNVLMEFYMSFQIDSNHEMTVQQLNCSCNKSMPTAHHKMLGLHQINFSSC